MTLGTATCDVELSGNKPPEWVHLLPAGNIGGRDGRTFLNDAPEVVLAAFKAGAIDLPIDYEHQSEHREKTGAGPVPAAGWIKDLELRGDGIWGRVSWTERAAELIRNREYRFLSPVVLFEKTKRRVMRLKSAGLVHTPNLHLTALASQEDPTMDQSPLIARLVKLLGLEDGADEEEIFAALEERLKSGGKPDPAKYVPIEALQDLMQKRTSDKAEMRQEHVAGKVRQAVADGYITPAMRDWATELCTANEAAFDTFVSAATPPYAHLLRESNMRGAPPSRGGQVVNDLANNVARQLGIDAARLMD